MNELEQDLTDKTQQIQHLQQRIRRMSTVPTAGHQQPDSEQVRALQVMVDRLRSESTISSQRIVGLEGELDRIRTEYIRDKQRNATAFALEMDRMRSELKLQGQLQRVQVQQQQASYLSTVQSLLWSNK